MAERVFWRLALAATALKLLLVPSYRSTDFEVHRNWLAITHTLPLREWSSSRKRRLSRGLEFGRYLDETSPWTLDYPPLFAWFERCLATVAFRVDPDMLVLDNLDYASDAAVLFQRMSVVSTDILLIAAAWYAAAKSDLTTTSKAWFFGMVVGNAGLLMVDHIHFQYNGMLLGMLLWSVLAVEEDCCVLAAVLFSVLLNMKHLFLYAAPVYLFYLLRHRCIVGSTLRLSAFCKLAATVLGVCGLSFGPFLRHGQLGPILSRLFPVSRGLCHAYWAPNFWALYTFADKVLSHVFHLSGASSEVGSANLTRGVIGQWSFDVLPTIPPQLAVVTALFFASLPAVLLFLRPRRECFMECVAYANLCGFVWGYHVHEKAILTVLLPLTFVAFRKDVVFWPHHRRHFYFLSTVAHYSLTPLLHEPREYPIKLLLVVSYALGAQVAVRREDSERSRRPVWSKLASFCKASLLLSLVLLESCQFLGKVMKLQTRFEFLPLMLTSVLCGFGVCGYWLLWTFHLFRMLPFHAKSKRE